MDLAALLILFGGGFLGMEAVTYLVHRFVMHGALERLHLSHHRNAAAEFAAKSPESNDAFPLAFSVFAGTGFWAGFNVDGFGWLLPLVCGVTVYGVVYTLVHDGIIHGRIRSMRGLDYDWARRLENAHRSHHRTNGEPYGMLFPWLTMDLDGADHDRPRFPSTGTERTVRTSLLRTSVRSAYGPPPVDAAVPVVQTRTSQSHLARD